MKHLQLKDKEERRLNRGHVWAYRNEFARLPALDDGELVDVFSNRGQFVGRGFYQQEGGIAVRLLARRQTPIDAGFWMERVGAAHAFRERLFPGESVYRWVFGESDGLPGFVADRYGPLVVCESACGFYRGYREELAEAFMAHEGVAGVRMSLAGEVSTFGAVPSVAECCIDGLHAGVDAESGQKTGLFLDQRANMRAMEPYAAGARVLDGHCYAGLWSLRAARAGACQVVGIDSSERAVDIARANAERNSYAAACRFETGDIAEVLKRPDRYDMVILDPPALAKARPQAAKALGLLQHLNRAGMQALDSGGVLVTSTCSHFISQEAFLECLKRAAAAAQRQVWLLEVRGAGPDHPVLMAMPETRYLTCAILRVL